MDWSYNAWPSGEPYDWGNAARGTKQYDAIDYHVDLGCGRLKKGRIGIDRYPAPGVNIVMDLNTLAIHAVAPEPGADAADLHEFNGVPYWEYNRGDYSDPEEELVGDRARLSYPCHGRFYLLDISRGARALPFDDGSIESIISHHALEHIGDGFLPLIDEVYRVLKPGGIFHAITPLFPSHTAVADADHCRYFMDTTWDAFCGTPGDTPQNCWLASFSVPYTQARFKMLDKDMSPPTPVHQMWSQEDAREIRVVMEAVK